MVKFFIIEGQKINIIEHLPKNFMLTYAWTLKN